MTYSEKLRDPRWKRKRVEVLERDEYECRNCQTRDNLEVHHTIYYTGVEPWDYDNDTLMSLCRNCHGELTLFKKGIKEKIDTKFKTVEVLYELNNLLDEIAGFNEWEIYELKKAAQRWAKGKKQNEIQEQYGEEVY